LLINADITANTLLINTNGRFCSQSYAGRVTGSVSGKTSHLIAGTEAGASKVCVCERERASERDRVLVSGVVVWGV